MPLKQEIPWGTSLLIAKNINSALLGSSDPAPVEWVNSDSACKILLLCEHAGNLIPQSRHQLGLGTELLEKHIAWDVGAAGVARKLAGLLEAPLIMQRYSRLLIDCNRPPDSEQAIPPISDGMAIPGNQKLAAEERLARQQAVFVPLDNAIKEGLEKHQRLAVFSIHSYTKQLNNQAARPWHAGMLSRKDSGTRDALVKYIKQQQPELEVAANEPYRIESDTDWFIPQYAESQGLMHSLIEIRNDQLRTEAGIDAWANLLASAINSILEPTS